MSGVSKEQIKEVFEHMAEIANTASTNAGWWHDPDTGEDLLSNSSYSSYVVATKLMLVMSEVIEGIEGFRSDKMDDKLPHRNMLEVELADAFIRLFDITKKLDLDVIGAILEKMDFNVTRPDHQVSNRRKKGGKKF